LQRSSKRARILGPCFRTREKPAETAQGCGAAVSLQRRAVSQCRTTIVRPIERETMRVPKKLSPNQAGAIKLAAAMR
jgi:hypothetical protein